MASSSKQSQKFFDLENPNDVAAIYNILYSDDQTLDVENNGDTTDTDTEENIEEREENSETDQDGESSGDESSSVEFFMGRDKETKWFKNKPSERKRRGPHNILLRLPGTLGDARNATTPFESWRCIFSDTIIETIVKYTNIYINKVQGNYGRERDAKTTDVVEYKCFIGLLYLAGVLRSNRQSLEELWGEDGFGVDYFRLAMNLKRFKFLIRCTRLDDINTRDMRKIYDKLAAVREVFDLFVNNCQKNFSLGSDVTVDEKLEGFRGRCSFIQYIPSKPNKYGLKIYASVDSKTFYTHNLEIYAGKQPEGPYMLSNKPIDIVMRLVQPLTGSGRNITCDNWFTSVELSKALKEKRLSLLGTLRKNKRQLPFEFVNTKSRPVGSSLFGFGDKCTLVSFVPKTGKNVLLISTLHNDNEVDTATGKPRIILDYNATKSGVDVVDKLCATYNVARNVRRWPMVIFFALLNIAGINGQIIYTFNRIDNSKGTDERRKFLKNLIRELCLEQLQRRSQQTVGMPTDLQIRLRPFQPLSEQPEPPTCHDGQRKRCMKCRDMKKVRYSKYKCEKCVSVTFCLEHAHMLCDMCYTDNTQ